MKVPIVYSFYSLHCITEHEKTPIAAVLGFLGHKIERLFSFRADFRLPSELLQAKRTNDRNTRTTVFTHFAIAYRKLDTVTVFHDNKTLWYFITMNITLSMVYKGWK